MLKVAHIVNDACGTGGVSRVAANLIRHSEPNTVQCQLISLKPAPQDRSHVNQSFETVFLPESAGKSETALRSELAALLKASQFDIVHTHSYRPNRIGRPAAWSAGTPCVIGHYHNLYADKWSDPAVLEEEVQNARASTCLIACSNSVKQQLISQLGIEADRVVIIPNGVELSRFAKLPPAAEARARLGLPQSVPLVGLIGRISRQKGHHDLIRAIPEIRRVCPDVEFVLAGVGKDRAYVAELNQNIRNADLSGIVHSLGFVSAVEDVYAAIDLLVMPSLWEGMPLTLLEAMAACVPVVATDIGPIAEVVDDDVHARLFPAGCAMSLADMVSDLLARREECQRLCANAVWRVEQFDWPNRSRQMTDLYTSLALR